MSFLKHTKHTDNFMEILVRDHRRYMPIVEFMDNVTQQPSELTWAEREQIAAEVSQTNGSDFCLGIHQGVAEALKADTELQKERLEPILAFVRKLVESSNSITEDDIQLIRDAGWNDQTIEDVIGIAAIITLFDILANGLGFGALSADFFKALGYGTVKAGYVEQFKSYIPSLAPVDHAATG